MPTSNKKPPPPPQQPPKKPPPPPRPILNAKGSDPVPIEDNLVTREQLQDQLKAQEKQIEQFQLRLKKMEAKLKNPDVIELLENRAIFADNLFYTPTDKKIYDLIIQACKDIQNTDKMGAAQLNRYTLNGIMKNLYARAPDTGKSPTKIEINSFYPKFENVLKEIDNKIYPHPPREVQSPSPK